MQQEKFLISRLSFDFFGLRNSLYVNEKSTRTYIIRGWVVVNPLRLRKRFTSECPSLTRLHGQCDLYSEPRLTFGNWITVYLQV